MSRVAAAESGRLISNANTTKRPLAPAGARVRRCAATGGESQFALICGSLGGRRLARVLRKKGSWSKVSCAKLSRFRRRRFDGAELRTRARGLLQLAGCSSPVAARRSQLASCSSPLAARRLQLAARRSKLKARSGCSRRPATSNLTTLVSGGVAGRCQRRLF